MNSTKNELRTEGYPVMLRLSNQRCIIVGGGQVSARKAAGLLKTGALITVISPVLHPDLEELTDQSLIEVRRTVYISGCLTDLKPRLVFAATDNPAINRQIAAEAQMLGALVNSVDDDTDSNFTNMAVMRQGLITLAIATDGASPALAAHLRQRLIAVVGTEYITLAAWMAEARPQLQATVSDQSKRAALWRQVLESSILDDLRGGDEYKARIIFEEIITR
ncbi:MAG: bifunctional precorrin-2 dehydrogenase/sirohydrochlorin ferrochelatase [Anaerolineae bacterium]|nr:bifunctional precorrin-2 dehydrogenase/sirohydrochlorin ferrochelatase [Anaerolineae bacterium]